MQSAPASFPWQQEIASDAAHPRNDIEGCLMTVGCEAGAAAGVRAIRQPSSVQRRSGA